MKKMTHLSFLRRYCALLLVSLSLLAGSLRSVWADGSVIFLPISQRDAQPLVTYVGPVAGTNLFIGLAVENDIVTAYICDSAAVSIWFKGMQAGDGTVLEAANGANVQVSFAGNEAGGTLTLPDGTTHVFAAQVTSGSQAGLFRLDRELDEGPYLLGGWIVLPNGEQRGALSANNTLIANPALNTSTLQTSVPLSTVLSTTTLPTTTLSTLTSTVTLQPVIVRPGILKTSRPNRPFEFVMVTLGDSYASGEGNPEQKGQYNQFGDRTGLARVWDVQDESREIQACHRSGQSGAEKAAAQLRNDFPGITLTFKSFACSGAEIKHLITETYQGVDAEFRFTSDGLPPQITALRDWLRDTRKNSQLDALYMNIGGNDARFGDVISVCIHPGKGDDCWTRPVSDDSPATLAQKVQAGLASLPERYEALNTALFMAYTSQAGVPTLTWPREIYITQVPDVTQNDDGMLCKGSDLSFWEWLSNVHPNEVAWARDNLIEPLNDAIVEAAGDRWNVITGVVAGFRRHGFCAADRYVNLNRDAVTTQGADYTEQPPWLLIGADKISAGIMHPNDKGFEEYAKHIRAAIAPQIRARFTPAAPANLRMGAVQPNGFIELQWDDRSNNEARFEFDYADIGLGLPNGRVNSVAGDRVNFVINTTRNEAFDVRVRACGPIPNSCSAYTPFLRVSNFLPDAPANFKITAPEFFTSRPSTVSVGWTDAAFNELTYSVEYDTFPASTTRRVLTLPANRTGATITDFPWRIRVRACNKVGCSAWSNMLLP
jgi:hypothetical protein